MVQQCQQALNDISTRHAVGLYWVPGHAGVRGNEINDKLWFCSALCWTWAFLGGFLGRISEERWNAGWRNSIWHCGVVPV